MTLEGKRMERLEELKKWATGKSLNGIETTLRMEAIRRYHCTEPTARSYATSVRMMLQEEQKPLASVQ
jgi:hypothetical protein